MKQIKCDFFKKKYFFIIDSRWEVVLGHCYEYLRGRLKMEHIQGIRKRICYSLIAQSELCSLWENMINFAKKIHTIRNTPIWLELTFTLFLI